MEKIAQLQVQIFERMASFDGWEPCGLRMIWPIRRRSWYRPNSIEAISFPGLSNIKRSVRSIHFPLIFHSDGRITEVIEDLIACGINALHPIEPKAMDIYELKQKYGRRVCLIGNIDLGETLTRGTPETVEEEVKQKISRLAPGGGYCIGSSNAITDYVPLENYSCVDRSLFQIWRLPNPGGRECVPPGPNVDRD